MEAEARLGGVGRTGCLHPYELVGNNELIKVKATRLFFFFFFFFFFFSFLDLKVVDVQ